MQIQPIRIMSFDIGIKNMAFCILERSTDPEIDYHLVNFFYFKNIKINWAIKIAEICI